MATIVWILVALTVGLLIGGWASTLRVWGLTALQRVAQATERQATRALPEHEEPVYMRSGAMPEDYFDWYPELAPRSHYQRLAEKVLADDTPRGGTP